MWFDRRDDCRESPLQSPLREWLLQADMSNRVPRTLLEMISTGEGVENPEEGPEVNPTVIGAVLSSLYLSFGIDSSISRSQI